MKKTDNGAPSECPTSVDLDVVTLCLGKTGGRGKELCVVAVVSCALGNVFFFLHVTSSQEGTWFHGPASLFLFHCYVSFLILFLFHSFRFIPVVHVSFVLAVLHRLLLCH